MSGFQILTSSIVFLFIIGFISILRRKKRLLTNTSGFLTIVTALTIMVVFIDPNVAQFLANLSGIGRGADLMIYLSILFLLFVVFLNFIHVRKINNQIVELARAIALMNAQSPSKEKQ